MLNAAAAYVLKKDLQCSSNIFRLTRASKVTMTRFRQLLQQRSIRIAAQTERKNANRVLIVQRLENLLQVPRSHGGIRVRDQDDAAFAGRKLRRHFDCL